jgi:hypothetical protein
MSDPKKPYSFLTLLKLYLRGMLDQQSLHAHMLENLVDVVETQQAHTALMEMMSEAIGELDQDIEVIAHYLHLTRPSQLKRDGDELRPDHNGSTGAPDEPADDEADD